jgi:hypothetical protein
MDIPAVMALGGSAVGLRPMIRPLLLAAALALSVTIMAEDKPPAPAPVAARPPADAAATAVEHTTKEITNTAWMQLLRAYAAEKHLKLVEQGQGPVRILLIGGGDAGDLKRPLELAQKALLELEAQTGMQETFISKGSPAEEVYWLTLCASNDQVGGFIDHLRAKNIIGKPEGEDLAKKTASVPTPFRVTTASLERVKPLIDEWAVYSTTCLAVDVFYRARDPKGSKPSPTWIREGLAADLQRQLCKRIACTTIAYEDKTYPTSDNWRGDVAKLIRSGDRQNKSASELMRLPLEALPNVFYQQMWSLLAFVRQASGQPKKGAKCKFREILDVTAAGESSETAVKSAFGKADPALTIAWRQWAQSSQ